MQYPHQFSMTPEMWAKIGWSAKVRSGSRDASLGEQRLGSWMCRIRLQGD